MIEKHFIKKIKECIKNEKGYIEKESLRLFKCGGIDSTKYENDFALPKIILTVAFKNLSDQYSPFNTEYRKEVKNLERF